MTYDIKRHIEILKADLAEMKGKHRRQYFREYYLANRDRKLAAANARHAAKRENKVLKS